MSEADLDAVIREQNVLATASCCKEREAVTDLVGGILKLLTEHVEQYEGSARAYALEVLVGSDQEQESHTLNAKIAYWQGKALRGIYQRVVDMKNVCEAELRRTGRQEEQSND